MHMGARLALFAIGALAASASLFAPTGSSAHEKSVWNYDGGIFLETDGSLSGGTCFRVSGRVTANHFFDDLKRIDKKDAETVFQRGKETVTAFPKVLLLQFALYDFPCSAKLRETGTRKYLTRAIVSELRLSLYWKHGLELRPLTNYTPVAFTIRPIYPLDLQAKDLPERLEWDYQLAIPSEGVPLTDSLVLIIRTPEEKTAARVAARM
ncbi:MAG TPA: hypothetical protein VE545_03950 [Candidatus Dormibacteraeota bacterium]|nr:hypothetical protein [Candidatus Dormibacteraeota bacterium]